MVLLIFLKQGGKEMKKLIMLFLLTLFLIMLPLQVKGASSNLISISPNDDLFDVKNMKPGDWAIKELTIENKADKEITYEVVIYFQSGSKKLFNMLEMQIEQNGKRLAGGKLGDLKQMESRKLDASNKETLTFIMDFPPELGNEFQGLGSKFQIEVSAAESGFAGGTDSAAVNGGISSTGLGGMLPNTATNIFNLFMTGLLLCGAGVIVYWWHRRLTSLRAD